MDRPVKIAHFGVGRMGRMITQYELDKQGSIVAAFDTNPELIGRDLGEILGLASLGVTVSPMDDAAQVLAEAKPDICTVSTKGTLAEMRNIMETCCRAGANVVTIGECAAWPWTTEPELTRELDALAKERGVTISASGYPDIFWQNLVLTLAGAQEKITRIHGTVTYNVEQYGPHFIVGHGVGLSQQAFDKKFQEKNAPGGYGANCMPGDPNGWLCNALGLTVTEQVMRNVPRLSDKAVWCESYGRDILPGQVLGTANVVSTQTEEGITVEMEVCGKIYAPGETDALTWEFEGVPGLKIVVAEPDTPVFTAASPVNRIPQVINARPGYVTTNELPIAPYLVKPMNEYVN